MSDARTRERLETQAIVIGYAMSRLDRDYFSDFVHIMVSVLLDWDMIKSQLVDGRR